MRNVVLLSEINPAGVSMFNPLQQAHEWYSLLNEADIRRLQKGSLSFLDAISLINDRCEESGKVLILRDWSHLDFIGLPFIEKPTYQLTLADELRENKPVINTATVRHPVYQWLSTTNLTVSQNLSLDVYLKGYRRFAEHCVKTGFIRYEDFTNQPVEQLTELCRRLSIEYDSGWRNRWWKYNNITGDSGGKGSRRKEITQSVYKKIDSSILDRFAASDDYQQSLSLLGYQHL